MKHILLVDDNLTNLKQAASLLKEKYKVSMAKSGAQALEFLTKYIPDLILMDIEMPDMDGYETTKRIKAMKSVERVPIIFLTGDQDVESEIRGFECGAVDYVRKPFVREIMLHRVALHLELFQYQQNLEKVLEEKTKELMETLINTERMKAELDLAGKLQQNMLPPILPETDEFVLYAHMSPAKETCGDMYEHFLFEDRYLVTAIGDASGKGIGAAVFMTQAKTVLNRVLKEVLTEGKKLEDALFTFNNELANSNYENLFLTMFISIIDLKTGQMKYCNAAHNPPLISNGNSKFEFLSCVPNFILGGVENIKFECDTIMLEPQSRLFLYTDGITESLNEQDELYGEERLCDAINNSDSVKTIEGAAEALFEDVRKFTGNAPQADDITILLLKFKKVKEEF